VIAQLYVIARKTEDILDAEGTGAQQVRLQGDAVPVAARHLKYRLDALTLQIDRRGEGTEFHDRALVIGDIDSMDVSRDLFRLLKEFGEHALSYTAFHGPHFTRDHKPLVFKALRQLNVTTPFLI
jgi:hypothetical protein